MKPKLKKNN